MEEKMKAVIRNKKIITVILLLLPILIELIISNKIEFNKSTVIRIGFFYGIYFLIFMYYILSKKDDILKKILGNLLKYRYVIALIALIVMVIAKISFSSEGIWAGFVGENEYLKTLTGEARAVRSDEWLVQTPIALGQTLNEEGYTLYNNNIGQGSINMIMSSAPVLDITALSRPLTWGYLLFGTDYGFSFYWSLKMLILIMVSIELALKITKKDKLLSITGGLMLGLAPAMMWWLSTAVAEGYMFGTAVIVLFGYYMENLDWKIWKKCLIGVGMAIFVPAFAFTLYPAFQIPFAFVMAIFMIHDFIKHKKELKKQDYIIMGISIIAIAGIIIRFLLLSWKDILIMMSTVYPGSRMETGGTFTINNFISYFANMFFPYTDKIVNPCEPSSYIYPFIALVILIIYFIGHYKEIKKDKRENKKTDLELLIALIVIFVFFTIWEFVGFNEILAKISLMYFSQPQRTHVVLGIVGTILTLMLLKQISGKKIFSKWQTISISSVVTLLGYILIKQSEYIEFFTIIKLEVFLAILFAMTYFLIKGNKKAFCYVMCIVAIIAGAGVNPITRGTDVFYKTELSQKIKEIENKDKESIWISRSNICGQYLIANGVNCINGVNTYPNFKWLNIVDPDGKYNEVYNRYAHINIILGEKTEFVLNGQADIYTAELTYKNLKDLNIKYYYTIEKLSDIILKEFNMETIYENLDNNQYIYSIN